MSAWWLEEDGHAPYPAATASSSPTLTERRDKVRAAIALRRGTFTPEWTRTDVHDAGVAFRDLMLEMTEPLITRVNRLPEKMTVEFLNIAGTSQLQGAPATVFVTFEVLDSLAESITIPAGFQVSGSGADGQDVFFETRNTLYAAPITVDSLATQTRQRSMMFKAPDEPGAPFQPFGTQPENGNALLIGISGTALITNSLTLLFQAASTDGNPTPVSSGGAEPALVMPTPDLEWAVLDAGTFIPVVPVRDETAGLTTTGLVELRAPDRWRASNPVGANTDPPLRWLRVRLLNGSYTQVPQLSVVKANVERADAGRTIYGETLVAVAGTERRQFALSQQPVVPNSLVLEVEEGPADDVTPDSDGQYFRIWTEAAQIADAASDARTFSVDGRTGIVSFGNDINGRSVPDGFGNVRAVSYRVGGSAAEHVAASVLTTVVSAVPGVVSVSNPLAASGGTDVEDVASAIQRGPQEIRALGRAVTIADYALYARQAPGADVARAHAVAAYHAEYPGARVPGVVTVFVVPPDRDGTMPVANSETLRSVADYLAAERAPLGIVVVAAAPIYQRVSVRVAIDLYTGVDSVRAVLEVGASLDRYLHPITGGEDGTGWPFGGGIRYDGLVRNVMSVTLDGHPTIRSIRTLDYKVDGRAVVGCADWAIQPESLLWPVSHQVVDARNAL